MMRGTWPHCPSFSNWQPVSCVKQSCLAEWKPTTKTSGLAGTRRTVQIANPQNHEPNKYFSRSIWYGIVHSNTFINPKCMIILVESNKIFSFPFNQQQPSISLYMFKHKEFRPDFSNSCVSHPLITGTQGLLFTPQFLFFLYSPVRKTELH
jgi:hypothetical protein